MESFLQNRPSLATVEPSPRSAAADTGFQPFLRAASLREKAPLLGANSPTNAGAEGTEPEIELLNRDGCVDRIVITCACCKRIELQCEY
jgi:hypothetical protein